MLQRWLHNYPRRLLHLLLNIDLPPSLEIDGLTEELPPGLIEAISRNVTAFLEGFADDPVKPPQYNEGSRLAVAKRSGNYAKGICSFHLKETHACWLGDRLFASVNLVDANKQKIGSDCGKYGENGVLIDEKNAPYELTSELPYVLLIHSPSESQPLLVEQGHAGGVYNALSFVCN
ncbi:hypothetical protein I7I51_06606 [Histoplasma capsulatum]|uniref:Uncharacterized protein n=1 Tax=Ajellomyces capsulatus TaxID=5037 RepID=A0A8A1MNW9_AJECA|nr:hypothetical protein I7I51_06606 [Histoplasma capsulatum]